ncbi:PREDICTED: probable serine/threonine-protein kinase mps1 [Ceratosolen solmsi marchali]|uniref:Probable serine/threonine-protein kinase mps1 n=1 Tax=Ceratosolen solmsi marchali TaxID=326594 RepID=A0AAJ6VK49_9HYME|nr:PREDICTED: probable serine/threonine-protein kinase mps1 [Ceratosolen solmsi marchali]
MEEQSFHEKEGLTDSSNVSRLSESRPKFKPVLVKKLLADVSDDDSDDQIPNSDNSDEDCDDFDSFQPLPDESSNEVNSKTLLSNTNIKINIATQNEGVSAVDGTTISVKYDNNKVIENIDLELKQKSILNSYRNDSLQKNEYSNKKTDEEKLCLDKLTKHKSGKNLTDQDSLHQLQWQSKCTGILNKRKSLPVKGQSESNIKLKSYSPDIKSSFYVTNQVNDVKDKSMQYFESFNDIKDNEYFSTSQNKSHIINKENDDKALASSIMQTDQGNNVISNNSNSISNTTISVIDTPMKQPHSSVRPNPCHSHRNIFQTPQNKIGNDYAKNPIQTPATIFSLWSQQHMTQTPMQNKASVTRETVQTPVTNISGQSQSIRHETPRYFSDGKSVRRPLAETVYSGSVHGPQLPKLQEVPNESHSNLTVTKDNVNLVTSECASEMKPLYSSCNLSHASNESKENWNPNMHDAAKGDKHSLNSHIDNKSHVEYHNNAYHKNMQASRSAENYENYQARENKSVHPQSEQISTIQCSVSQKPNVWNTRQNKMITVIDQQYLVLGVIGQGMSCEVVRAQNLSTSELRAIKCVNLSKMDKDSAQGCLQEICMLEKLKAPCIVHMYDFEIKQPWVHVVMEIGDTDLSRLLKSMLHEKKQLPLSMILYYWTEMLTAVKHIHDNGVIHSDLKPANFLLVRGRLKLIDFGIASNINSDMTSVVKNCPIGTINYISPEALMDINAGVNDSPNHNVKFKISYKSDVWSLGCILYGLVYGVTPFNHIRQQWAKISAITDPKHKINFPLRTGSEPVPSILIDVMRKCLQRNPKVRPTVADLLKIPYLQTNIGPSIPDIPSNILIKIKHALSEDEWQQLTEVSTAK